MGIIKDFNESPNYVKSIIGSLIFLSLLFIFSFIYYHSFILQYGWYLIISAALAISIGYYVVNIINIYLQCETIFKRYSDINLFWILSILQPVVEFGIIIIICLIFNFTFKSLILISFILNAWRILYFGSFYFLKKNW